MTKTTKTADKQRQKLPRLKITGWSRLGPFSVGDSVVIRAIPFHYIGKIELLTEHTVTLAAGAVWLADSGRWSDCLATGEVSESEPYPDGVTIRYEAIADVTVWRHAIPGRR